MQRFEAWLPFGIGYILIVNRPLTSLPYHIELHRQYYCPEQRHRQRQHHITAAAVQALLVAQIAPLRNEHLEIEAQMEHAIAIASTQGDEDLKTLAEEK